MSNLSSVNLLFGYNTKTKQNEGILYVPYSRTLTDLKSTSKDYDGLYFEFAKQLNTDALSVDIRSLWSHDTIDHIPFTYDLCSEGGYFVLYFFDQPDKETIKKYKRLLRHEHDVVSLCVQEVNLINWQSSNPLFKTIERPSWLLPKPEQSEV